MSSRIEQIIDEIEEFIENCKYQPLSNTKIVVNKDELEDFYLNKSVFEPSNIDKFNDYIKLLAIKRKTN